MKKIMIIIIFLLSHFNIKSLDEDSFLVYDLNQEKIVLGHNLDRKINLGSLHYPLILKIAEKNFNDDDFLRISGAVLTKFKEEHFFKINHEFTFSDFKKMTYLIQDPQIIYSLADNTSGDFKRFKLLLKNLINNYELKDTIINDLVDVNNLSSLNDALKIALTFFNKPDFIKINNLNKFELKEKENKLIKSFNFNPIQNEHIKFIYEDRIADNLIVNYQDDNLDLLIISTNKNQVNKETLINQLIDKLKGHYYVLNLKDIKPYHYSFKKFMIDQYYLEFNFLENDLIYFQNEADVNFNYQLVNRKDLANIKVELEIFEKTKLIKKIELNKIIKENPNYVKDSKRLLIIGLISLIMLVFLVIFGYRKIFWI